MKTEDKRPFAAGDRVKYSARFLKNIGTHPTDELWRVRGTVQGEPYQIGPLRMVKVQWDDEDEPRPILTDNVCKKGELSHRTAVLD